MDAKVSVIMPCYASAATVGEAIESALSQTVGAIEVIAVDDGSPDTSADVVADFARHDTRVRLVRQPNGGCAAARNTGIKNARAPFIGLLDADDRWPKNYVEAHLRNCDQFPDLGVSYCPFAYADAEGQLTGEKSRPKLAGVVPEDFLAGNPCGSAIIARRELFTTVGLFNAHLRRCEDQEWLLRVALAGHAFRGTDDTAYEYRAQPGSMSGDLDAQLATWRAMVREVATYAPGFVKRHAPEAEARMERYLSRHAIRRGYPTRDVRRHILAAVMKAPGLLLSEPKPTLGPLLAALVPGARPLLYPARS